MRLHYNWKRFWCPRSGSYDLSDDGFLLDPYSERAKYSNTDAITFEKINNIQCLILLGEPGIGKSTAINSEIETFQESKENVLFNRNLNHYGDESRFINEIFNNDTINQWKQDKSNLYIYLDSFDECLISISKLINIFQLQFDNLKDYKERLNLVISCRTGDWPETLLTFLTDFFGKNNVGVYELLPLRKKDIIETAKLNGINSEKFLTEIILKEIQALAITPLTLNFLIEEFKRNKRFPNSKDKLYQNGCKILCEEHNPNRDPKEIYFELSADRRLILASRIAAIMIFSNKATISLGFVNSDEKISTLNIYDIGEGQISFEQNSFSFTQKNIKETITQTALFVSRGSNKFGFAHFTYPEYLAAKYLIWNNLPIEKLKSLTTISIDDEYKTIPQIKNTTAWLYSLSNDFLLLNIQNDPQNILIGDIDDIYDELKFRLVEALIIQLDNNLIDDSNWSLPFHYRKLKHPLLHEQLNPIIINKEAYYITRRVSIEIAAACNLAETIDILLKISLDETDNLHIRTEAARALVSYANAEVKKKLMPLAKKVQETDKDDDLKGIALRALWPEYLSAKELFESLSLPKRENYTGSYVMFLYNLWDSLQIVDIDEGLNWLSNFNKNNDKVHFKFEQLENLIIHHAWLNISKIKNLNLFAKAIIKRITNYEDIFPQYDGFASKSINYPLEDEYRIRLLKLILNYLELDKIHLLVNIGTTELITADNFLSIFNLFLVEENADLRKKWARLLNYLITWSVDNIGLIAENIKRYPELNDEFGGLFNSVELNSKEAEKLINDYNERRELRKKNEERKKNIEKKNINVRERIESNLGQFEKTNDSKWWYHLFLDLTIEENKPYYGDEYKAIIEELPGWKYVDEDIEKRIVNSAKHYILNFSENSEKWFGKNIIYRPAYSGYKTLLYLMKKDPQFILELKPSQWQKWIYIILDYLEPFSSGEDKTYLKLLNHVYEKAPSNFLSAFKETVLLQCKLESSSFNVIEKVKLLFDENIESVLMEILQEHDLNLDAKSHLLGILIGRNTNDAFNLIKDIAFKNESSTETIVITSIFLNYCTSEDWEIIKTKIDDNVAFGKALFLSYPKQRQYEGKSPLNKRLTEIQIAELYIWLSINFPKEKYADTAGLHKPDENEYVWHLRRGLISALELKGNAAAIEALKLISTKLKNENISYYRIKANESYRKNNWNPLEPYELIKYIDKAKSKLLQNEDDLIQLLIESLHRANIELQGANPMSFSLWDTNKPKNEEALSAYLNNFIKKDLDSFPLISFREVQLRPPKPHEGANRGEKIDIFISAINTNTKQQLTVIIEVKGSWNSEVNESMVTQLSDRYLSNGVTTHGIYLIGWYDCVYWTNKKNSTKQKTIKGARSKYKKQAESLSVNGKVIKSFVLDCRYNN